MPNNTERAAFTEGAIGLFMSETGSDEDTAASDFICDLLHAEKLAGRDPLHAVRNGLCNFIAEASDAHEDGMYVQAQVDLSLRANGKPWDLLQASKLREASFAELNGWDPKGDYSAEGFIQANHLQVPAYGEEVR